MQKLWVAAAVGATPTPPAAAPYAPALSSYSTVAQSYSANDIINDGWAQDANATLEGGGTCPVTNTTYSSSLDAVVMSTAGQEHHRRLRAHQVAEHRANQRRRC